MPSSAAAVAGRGASAVNAAAAAAAMSSDISRRNPQEDYELLQVRTLETTNADRQINMVSYCTTTFYMFTGASLDLYIYLRIIMAKN